MAAGVRAVKKWHNPFIPQIGGYCEEIKEAKGGVRLIHL